PRPAPPRGGARPRAHVRAPPPPPAGAPGPRSPPKAEGKSCGVCGEAASDPLLASVLTGLGVTSLSMGAASIPYVRAALAKFTLAQCERAAAAARATDSAEEARRAAQTVLSGE
ncbi:putative PEP-binding protein, partial [Streptomyces hirsutus]|uniref:putative PEP-binding protein n=1 Tax=Streptomyces hirsutus TaxID=35620 RepID=UPI00365C4200